MAELVDVPGLSQIDGSYRTMLCEITICVTTQGLDRSESS